MSETEIVLSIMIGFGLVAVLILVTISSIVNMIDGDK